MKAHFLTSDGLFTHEPRLLTDASRIVTNSSFVEPIRLILFSCADCRAFRNDLSRWEAARTLSVGGGTWSLCVHICTSRLVELGLGQRHKSLVHNRSSLSSVHANIWLKGLEPTQVPFISNKTVLQGPDLSIISSLVWELSYFNQDHAS